MGKAARKRVSKIGGQAVLEGVMMRGTRSMATAVRDEFGGIVVESSRILPAKEKCKVFGLPIIRGVVAFLDSLINGTKILLKSAEVYGGDTGEPTAFEKWLSEKSKINVMDIAVAIGLVLGLAMSVGLFFILPQLIATGIFKLFSMESVSQIVKNFIEGGIRILIFVGYILLVSLIADIKRTFMYHGAEHKVISCYEAELPMTVENARKMSTRHDRCGTTFLFIVMVISIVVFSLLGGWAETLWLRIIVRLALLPLVAGISYEILKLLALSNNIVVRILKSPGMLLQMITTKEPTDDMLEVSLTAFETVMKLDADPNYPLSSFVIKKAYQTVRNEVNTILAPVTSETAEADWIFCKVLGIKRSALSVTRYVEESQYEEIIRLAKERATGKPLQHVLGSADFYGLDILVDGDVLIPRFETEILVEKALPYAKGAKVLDICTGSGAIAIAIAANSDAEVTAADISEIAIVKARINAEHNKVSIETVVSDLFAAFAGRKFDVITANPPYIPSKDIEGLQKEVKDYEPRLALDGGADGLDIVRRIAAEVGAYLNNNGNIFVEIGAGQSEEAAAIFSSAGYKCEIIKDLDGKERIIRAEQNV